MLRVISAGYSLVVLGDRLDRLVLVVGNAGCNQLRHTQHKAKLWKDRYSPIASWVVIGQVLLVRLILDQIGFSMAYVP